jgi:uncharacterized protein (TIGR03086 family)
MTEQTDTTTTAAAAPAVDPRPLFLRSADQAVAVMSTVQSSDLDRPTPCTEFDVRALCGHVIGVLRRITAVARKGDALAVPSTVTDVADAELAATAAADARLLAEAWAEDAVLDRAAVLPFGTMPGRFAAMAYTQELTVHAWDLATALGRPELLDDHLAEVAEVTARRFLPAETRGGPVPFGPVVDVPPSAAPYARLAGWLGRDPGWKPPV